MTAEAVRRQYAKNTSYHQDQRAERYAKINEYKLSKGCIDCGYADDPVALDFDHRNPSVKIERVSLMLTYSWRRIVAELDKCDIRCANCHRIKTYHQKRRRPGTDEDVSSGPLPRLRTTS